MENLEKQFHQLTHNAMLSVNRQFDDAVIWEWIITNFEPKDSNKVDAVVSGKFAEEDIKKRYNTICKQIELWQKRIEKEWSYEDGYKNGLVYAEKQFRNLFS